MEGAMDHLPTILVADDDIPVRILLADLLDNAGYRVLTTPDGAAALTCAHTEQPDLILTDVMMPHVNGVELCQALAADPQTARIPVILMSAAHRESVLADCPGARFLAKPFKHDTLLNLIAASVVRERARGDGTSPVRAGARYAEGAS
jgi:CheY-like chemotaxis protein